MYAIRSYYGRLQFTKDGKYLKLTLFDGVKYDEKVDDNKRRSRDEKKLQFRRNNFV